MKAKLCLGMAGAMLLSGCTFVKLSDHAQDVLVLKPYQARECVQVRRTTSQVLDKVWFVNRNRDRMAEELETLARNTAAELGGNAVVADSDIEPGGRQRFIVYDCQHMR